MLRGIPFFIFFLVLVTNGADEIKLPDFKDDFIGVYSTVIGNAIRYNYPKDKIGKIGPKDRIYIGDVINTQADQKVTLIFHDGTIIQLGEESHLKILKYSRRYEQAMYESKHGKIRISLPSEKMVTSFNLNGVSFSTKRNSLTFDVYHNSAKESIVEIAPLEKRITLDKKTRVYPGTFVVMKNGEFDQRYRIKKSLFKNLVYGHGNYKYIFDKKLFLIDKEEVDKLANDMDKLIDESKDDNFVLIDSFKQPVEVFSKNPYYHQAKIKLDHHHDQVGLKDIPLYKKHIRKYVELEKEKRRVLYEINFIKSFYDELINDKKNVLESRNESEIKLLKEDYNKYTDEYSALLMKQEDVASNIESLREKFRLEKMNKRSPAQIEMEIEKKKQLAIFEINQKHQSEHQQKLIGYQNEIQQIELLMERIRKAKSRIMAKTYYKKREPNLKEFAQKALLEESYKKLRKKRKAMVKELMLARHEGAEVYKEEERRMGLYNLRTPASSEKQDRKIIKDEDTLFGGFFDGIEKKVKAEALRKSREFKLDPGGEYQKAFRFKNKNHLENYRKSQNDRFETLYEIDP